MGFGAGGMRGRTDAGDMCCAVRNGTAGTESHDVQLACSPLNASQDCNKAVPEWDTERDGSAFALLMRLWWTLGPKG